MTDESFGQCAAALRRAAPAVLSVLEARLRGDVPQLADVPRSHLIDALPQVIDQLAAVLEFGPEAVEGLQATTDEHAEHRKQQELDLDRLLREYQVLREIIGAALVEELGRELSPSEALRLHSGIDLSIRRAAGIFVDQQRQRLQHEAAAMAKYLSFLSHDLRGNLNGAMLMIEVLRRDLQHDDRFAESVHDLDATRQSMLELVGTMDRFLEAERLRQGRVEVSLQTVDLADFLEEQRRSMSRQVRGCEGQIQIEAPPGLKVRTDREMLSLIIHNTLSNCVKYSNGGPVRMVVTPLQPADSGEPICRVEVSDTGPGIDPDFQARLFEPFVRGNDTGRPGTGLGLYIAKQAADLLGAMIEVDSRRGEGTTFILEVPNYSFKGSQVASRDHNGSS